MSPVLLFKTFGPFPKQCTDASIVVGELHFKTDLEKVG